MKIIKVNVGDKFGRLTVMSNPVGAVKWGQKVKVCMAKCDCGKEKEVVLRQITKGIVSSCGCLFNEMLVKRNYKHGMYSKRNKCKESRVWSAMVSRCYNENETSYPGYGGRGITVCDSWRDDFDNFLSDMGPMPSPKHSIERINVNGNYEPSNCKWATWKEQANNKRNSAWLEYNGERLTLAQWANKLGVNYVTLYGAIKYRGKTIDYFMKAA